MLVTRLRQTLAAGLLAAGLIGVGGAFAQQFGRPPQVDPNPLAPAAAPDALFVQQDEPIQSKKEKEAPKKITAKGVEDDDVPYSSFPGQAVVRVEDGKLIVRQRVRSYSYGVVTPKNGDQTVTSHPDRVGVQAATHDPADVAVFDMKGNRLSPKAWKEMLKSDVHALIAHDGKLPNPRELTLFKADTLLIVLPASTTRAVYETWTTGGNSFYVPGSVTPAQGRPGVPFSTPVAPPAPPAPAQPGAPRATPTRPASPPAPAQPPVVPDNDPLG